MRRLRYRHELTEIELYDAFARPSGLDSMLRPGASTAHVPELLGHAVLFLVRAVVVTLGVTARVALPILGELVCIALAALGCTADIVGRAAGLLGRAAARRSWVITTGRDALAQLPPRRVERERRTAIAVRVIR